MAGPWGHGLHSRAAELDEHCARDVLILFDVQELPRRKVRRATVQEVAGWSTLPAEASGRRCHENWREPQRLWAVEIAIDEVARWFTQDEANVVPG
jgi:hypothetical protein